MKIIDVGLLIFLYRDINIILIFYKLIQTCGMKIHFNIEEKAFLAIYKGEKLSLSVKKLTKFSLEEGIEWRTF